MSRTLTGAWIQFLMNDSKSKPEKIRRNGTAIVILEDYSRLIILLNIQLAFQFNSVLWSMTHTPSSQYSQSLCLLTVVTERFIFRYSTKHHCNKSADTCIKSYMIITIIKSCLMNNHYRQIVANRQQSNTCIHVI